MNRTLERQDAPHIRHLQNTRNLMLNIILMLFVLYAMAFYYYGPRSAALGIFSILVCVISDSLIILMFGRRPHRRDLSAVVTGMIIPLLMPASVPYYVVAVACIVAIVATKQPFGGVGNNIFNPAAAGFSFVAISFNSLVFNYPLPQQWLPIFGKLDFISGVSPALTLDLGAIPKYEILDMALGNFPGPMGATNILVILACLLYLVLRNTVRWEMPVSFLFTVFIFAIIFPRIPLQEGGRLLGAGYEMMSGIILFGGVFLLGDPVTTPKRDLSKVGFGVVAGIVVMLFSRYSRLEIEFTFALLLMNATVWAFDMLGEYIYNIMRRKRYETVDGKKV